MTSTTHGGPREGAGRPEVGPPINVRLSEELLARVDAYAAWNRVQRAPAIRRLITIALEDTMTVTAEDIRALHTADYAETEIEINARDLRVGDRVFLDDAPVEVTGIQAGRSTDPAMGPTQLLVTEFADGSRDEFGGDDRLTVQLPRP